MEEGANSAVSEPEAPLKEMGREDVRDRGWRECVGGEGKVAVGVGLGPFIRRSVIFLGVGNLKKRSVRFGLDPLINCRGIGRGG